MKPLEVYTLSLLIQSITPAPDCSFSKIGFLSAHKVNNTVQVSPELELKVYLSILRYLQDSLSTLRTFSSLGRRTASRTMFREGSRITQPVSTPFKASWSEVALIHVNSVIYEPPQFGRDILFITSYRSEKFCDRIQVPSISQLKASNMSIDQWEASIYVYIDRCQVLE